MGGEPEPTRWPGQGFEPTANVAPDQARTVWSGPLPPAPAVPGGDAATRWTVPPGGAPGGTPGLSPFGVPRLVPGLQLGPWRLEAELGRGGMGAVWRATDATIRREVALKVLLDLASHAPDARARFLREGQLGARVDHPGIVRIYAVGEAPVPWLACELVQGARSLTAAAAGRPPEEGAALVAQAARALGAAHARGVVHRDVKPDNLLVGQDGRVRVTDFGISTAHDVEWLTVTGRIMGTPSYMAPEQLEGQRVVQGPWTDVWALGVVLYEVLTGERPFGGGSVMEIAARVINSGGDFRRPRALRPELSPALEAVVLGALVVEPGRRWHDGDAFADELERALAADDAAPPPSRWPLPVGVALGLALAVGAGAWALTRPGPPPVAGTPGEPPATEPGPPPTEPAPLLGEPTPTPPTPTLAPSVAEVWSRTVAISWDDREPEVAPGLEVVERVEVGRAPTQLVLHRNAVSSVRLRFRLEPGTTWARAHVNHLATKHEGTRASWIILELNGQTVDPRHEPWHDVPIDLSPWIRAGDNELVITLHPDSRTVYWLKRFELRSGSGEAPPVFPGRH